MRRSSLLLCCSLILAGLWGPIVALNAEDATAPDPGLASETLRNDFLKWKFGMFVCFHLGTFTDQEWAGGYEDPAAFAPAKLDCGQWADAAKAAGMKYGVLTVKHTEGYPLWDSACTTHDIAAFKNFRGGKGDVVREFVDAFRSRGLKVGLYYCAPGDYDGQFGNTLPEGKPSLHGMPPEAAGDDAKFMAKQFTELLTKYGPIDLIWCDQYKVKLTPGEWSSLRSLVKSLQPNCLLLANNSHDFKETDIHSFEYPIYMDDHGYPPPGNTIPSEVCDCITSDRHWFWHPDSEQHLRSAEEIVKVVRLCNERDANYLLSVPPDRNGRIPEAFVKRLKEVGRLLNEQASR